MAKESVFLSVDWDYFFRPDPFWDWGHSESPFFVNEMWSVRFQSAYAHGMDLTKRYVPVGHTLFWRALIERGFDFTHAIAFYGDSHLGAYPAFNEAKRRVVYNFDFHHDLLYQPPDSTISCENWLYHLLVKRRYTEAVVVYPYPRRKMEFKDTLDERPELWPMCDRVSCKTIQELSSGERRVERIFIARSGAWTPPWADKAFMRLVNSCPALLKIPIINVVPKIGAMGDTVAVRKWDRDANVARAEQMRNFIQEVRNGEANDRLSPGRHVQGVGGEKRREGAGLAAQEPRGGAVQGA